MRRGVACGGDPCTVAVEAGDGDTNDDEAVLCQRTAGSRRSPSRLHTGSMVMIESYDTGGIAGGRGAYKGILNSNNSRSSRVYFLEEAQWLLCGRATHSDRRTRHRPISTGIRYCLITIGYTSNS